MIPLLVAGGAALLGGIMGKDAAKDAARTQAEGAAAATAESQRQYDLSRADIAPYKDLGYTGLDTMRRLLGIGTRPAMTREMLTDQISKTYGKQLGLKPVNGRYELSPEHMSLVNGEVERQMARGSQFGEMMQDVPFNDPGAMPGDSPLPTFNYPGYGRTMRDMGRLSPGQDGVMVPTEGGPMMAREGPGMLPPEMRSTGSRYGSTIPTFNYDGGTPFEFNLEKSPGYDFRLGEGMKTLENSAAGRTGILSGNTMRAMMELGQNMASDEYDREYGRSYNRWLERDVTGYNRARDSYLTDIDIERNAYARAGDEFSRNLTLSQLRDARAWNRYGQRYSESTDAYNRTNASRMQRFNTVANVTGMGQQSVNNATALGAANASNIGNLAVGAANANAASRIASTNAVTGAAQNLGNTYLMSDWLKAAQRTPTGTPTNTQFSMWD